MINSLTSLRLFLAIWVLLFHTSDIWKFNIYLFNFISSGYSAVNCFFILSGFILAYRYRINSRLDIKQFYKNRLLRIYPSYLFSILFALPLYVYYVYKTKADFLNDTIKNLFFSILGIQSFFKDQLNKINPPSWSLSNELLFYFVFPLFFYLVCNLNKKLRLILFLMIIIYNLLFLKASINYLEFIILKNNCNISIAAFPLAHLHNFIVGILLYFVIYNYQDIIKKYLLFFKFIIYISLILLFVTQINNFVNLNNGGLSYFFCSLLIVLYFENNCLNNKWIIKRGEESYILYLIHIPMLSYFRIMCNKINLTINGFLELVLYMTICLSFAKLIHIYIEKPIIIKFKN